MSAATSLRRFAAAVVLVTQATGCATRPADIPPRYLSPLVFAQASCRELLAEQATLDAKLEPLRHRINRNANIDAAWVGVYVPLLVLLPFTFFLLKGDGAQYEEYSSLAGQRDAVRAQLDSKHCHA